MNYVVVLLMVCLNVNYFCWNKSGVRGTDGTFSTPQAIKFFFIKLKTQESSQNIRLGMKQQLHLSIFWDLHHLKITSSVMTSLHT